MAIITLSKLKSIIQGQESQKKGQAFENQISRILRDNQIAHIRIPQSSQVVKDQKTKKLITIKKQGPLDFVLFSKGKAYLIDCKTTNKNFLYKSVFDTLGKSNSSSTQKQFNLMSSIHQKSRFVRMGFVINFNGSMRYISIKKMIAIFKKRKSVTSKEGISFERFIANVRRGI